jgi:hypothetical protein
MSQLHNLGPYPLGRIDRVLPIDKFLDLSTILSEMPYENLDPMPSGATGLSGVKRAREGTWLPQLLLLLEKAIEVSISGQMRPFTGSHCHLHKPNCDTNLKNLHSLSFPSSQRDFYTVSDCF